MLWLWATLVPALAGAAVEDEPPEPDELDEDEPVVQVFTWAESAPLQEPGELQITGVATLVGALPDASAELELELGLVRGLQVGVELEGGLVKRCACETEVGASVAAALLARERTSLTLAFAAGFSETVTLTPALQGMWTGTGLHLAISASVGIPAGEEDVEALAAVAVVVPAGWLAPRVEASLDGELAPALAAGVSIWPGDGLEIGLAGTMRWDGAPQLGAQLALTVERDLWEGKP